MFSMIDIHNRNAREELLFNSGGSVQKTLYSISPEATLDQIKDILLELENVKFERKIFRPFLQPMDFICMDLIGEFHPPTSCGYHYALTAVCMLTGFTWCIPLKTKTAEEVSKAYLDHIYSNFGGSVKIMMDNGTEFKNKLFKEVVRKLGTEFSIHLPPYRPQSNGKIEGFHRFLKTCISKHINHGLERDELTLMATACYNIFSKL